MWAKNVLLATILLLAIALLAFNLAPIDPTLRDMAIVDQAKSIRAAVARLDAALESSWHKAGIVPADTAEDLLVARRLSLALTGSIPSLEDTRYFESLPTTRRLDLWLAELLADRRASDYLAERFARGLVGVEGGPPLLYRRRRFVSWLADEIAANRSYAAIVARVIAEDGLWTDRPAVNFVTVTINPGDTNRPDPNRLAARVARGMLAVRLDCAECHDHPFAAWRQTDFQALAAFFASTKHSLRGVRDDPDRPDARELHVTNETNLSPAVPFKPEYFPRSGDLRTRLAGWVTHPGNRAFARASVNRAWAILFGRPLLEPIDDLPLGGPFPAPLEVLADDFINAGFDLRRLLTVIASCRAFRLDSRMEAESDSHQVEDRIRLWAVFPLTRLRPEQVVGSLLQSASLTTLDYDSNILVRTAREIGQAEFIEHYGDAGADEFLVRSGTTPQRLLLMNGATVAKVTRDDLLASAATRIATLAPSDDSAIDTCFLTILTRRPTLEEKNYFANRLRDTRGGIRNERLGDVYWSLFNSTEFSWNH